MILAWCDLPSNFLPHAKSLSQNHVHSPLAHSPHRPLSLVEPPKAPPEVDSQKGAKKAMPEAMKERVRTRVDVTKRHSSSYKHKHHRTKYTQLQIPRCLCGVIKMSRVVSGMWRFVCVPSEGVSQISSLYFIHSLCSHQAGKRRSKLRSV